MGRQRTINDKKFWNSPRMSGCTIEDRFALFYLLTCPASNITGSYAIIPRIAAAEIGWDTESQLLPVLRRLSDSGFIKYDAETSFVWVRIWWEHHHPKVAMGPMLSKKTIKQIREMPCSWVSGYLDDLLKQLQDYHEPKEGRDPSKILIEEFGLLKEQASHPPPNHRVSIPYDHPIDTADGNGNNISKINHTTTNKHVTPEKNLLVFPSKLKGTELSQIEKHLEEIPFSDAQDILDEMEAAIAHSKIERSPIQWLVGVLKKHEQGLFKLTPAAIGIRRERVQLQHAENVYINSLQSQNM